MTRSMDSDGRYHDHADPDNTGRVGCSACQLRLAEITAAGQLRALGTVPDREYVLGTDRVHVIPAATEIVRRQLAAYELAERRPDVDPLGTTDDGLPLAQTCRVCSCTDYAACAGGCSWIVDPVGLGPLCSRCLEIAVAVTSQDPEAMATYDPSGRRPSLVVAPGPVDEDHGAWLLGSVIAYGCSGAIAGLVIGFALGALLVR